MREQEIDVTKARYRFDKLDNATDNFFFSRALEALRTKVYEVQYPMLQGRTMVPVSNDVDTGAEEVTVPVFDISGDVEVTSDYSTKGPRADASSREVKYKIRGLKASYGYSLQEARAAALASRLRGAGQDLPAAKAKAARTNIERKLDELIFFGSKIGGFTGLTNNPNVPTLAVAGAWSAATPLALVADLQNIVNAPANNSNSVEAANTLAIADTLYRFLTQKLIPNTSTTVLNWFLASNPNIRVIPSWRLNTSGAAGAPQIIAYDLNSEKLEALIPQEFEQLPPETEGFEFVTQCHARSGGTPIHYPKSMVYATGMGTV